MKKISKARSLKQPRACRYCGHVASDHAREGLAQCVSYACRDEKACGERIRGGKPIDQAPADGLPF